MKKGHLYCAKTIVFGRLLNDGLSKAFIRALPFGTVWEDEPSPSVVPGVANRSVEIKKKDWT